MGILVTRLELFLTENANLSPQMKFVRSNLRNAKSELRHRIIAALAAISAEQRAAGSAKICARLRELPAWKNAKSVLFFAPMPEEPDIWPLVAEALAAGKMTALPRFHAATRNYTAGCLQNLRSDIVPGHFGIREPAARCPEISLNHFDLVLVPGIAFDWRGRRLGRGKGYYDRLLAEMRGVKCGIAFAEQLVDEVPTGPSDVHLDLIVTPERDRKTAD
jgi:5-formyltetrahydrofolate cyclo-ligase